MLPRWDMTRPTILVTGGSGFIGKNIVEYYHKKANLHKAKVLAPSHAQLDLLSTVEVNRFFKEHRIDYIINCANIGGDRKSREVNDIVEKNLRVFCNLYDNLYASSCKRMIHFGSGAEYDKSKPINNVKESDFNYPPKDSYGFSKYLMSRLISEACDEDVICLRLFGVFGKYEDYTFKFISNSIVKYLLGWPIHIRQNVLFDWLYVNDLVELLPAFLDMESYFENFYNITPGNPVDLLTIAEIINTPKKVEIIVENPGMGYEYTGSNHRLLKNRLVQYQEPVQFTPMPTAISNLKLYYKSILSTADIDKVKNDELRTFCKVV
jgi:nucleoside-diphosphate-sugar epimerase